MRAAELQYERLAFPEDDSATEPGYDPRDALKQQVAERLAAHRSRRGQQIGANPTPIAEPKTGRGRANRIASAVAERYAQTPSYREFLATEAARAIEEAHAKAEVAARNAEAVTAAQLQLLAELTDWEQSEPGNSKADRDTSTERSPSSAVVEIEPPAQIEAPASGKAIQHPAAGFTVRLYEDTGIRSNVAAVAMRANQPLSGDADRDDEENFLLDDEITFRQTPVFAERGGPAVPIAANLIEFPRQLVAPRKARPRIAEGPLREEGDATAASAQLRIFEVEPNQIATSPSVGVETVVAEWSSIHLDAAPASLAPAAQEELQALLPLETASFNLRAMAAAVDGCILGFTFLAAVVGFAFRAAELPALPIAAAASAAAVLILFILYHLLFFTFSDATPGMRYARIGLCTFSDENPSRAQMRRRTWAILLSVCPLGLGFLWALLDDDRLGWHDRISRMYQRGY